MSSTIPSLFQARKNKLLSRSEICKIKYIYTFMFVESDFSYEILRVSRLSYTGLK